MLNKNIDYALIGHNYLTFILSLGLVSRGKNVLMLDDDRFNYGDFFINSLTEIDRAFITILGDKNKNISFVDMNNYISTEERLFFIGKKQILLGRSPAQNLMELCRKFPNVFLRNTTFDFNPEFMQNFDLEYKNYCQKVAHKLGHPDKRIKLFQIFTECFEENMKIIFNNFIQALTNKNELDEVAKADIITLVYLTRGFFQSHFSTSGSKVELCHGLLSLLSPYYKLNYHQLNLDLLEIFKKSGGEFKKLNLGDLKFQKGLIKGVELESFEGLINPKKIIFVGGHPLGLPIRFERPKNIFNCLSAEILIENVPKDLIGKKIIFSSPMKISTSRPMFEADFFHNKILLNIVVAKKNGVKIEFIEKNILNELQSDLKYLFADHDLVITSSKMQFTHDIFIEENQHNNIIKDELKFKTKLTEMLFSVAPTILNRPRNVYYMGPYNDGFLGTLSSLLEIYRWQEKI